MANILKTLELTQEEYNNLEVKDNDTMYITESAIYIGSKLMTDRINLLNEINKIQQEVDVIDESVDNLKENTVSSINGETGTVTIDIPDTSTFATKTELSTEVQTLNNKIDNLDIESDVTSVNGQTGDVIINIPDTSNFATKTELSTEVQTLNDKIDNIDVTSDVTSVNGQTGDVTINIPTQLTAGTNISISSNKINAEGYTYNSSNNSISIGTSTANAPYSFASGYNNNIPSSCNNNIVGGANNTCSHGNSFLYGEGLNTADSNEIVFGKYNKYNHFSNWGAGQPALEIGGGSSNSSRVTLFMVQKSYGAVLAKGEIKTESMGDFAEYFEWLDGNANNEDRVGYMVQLNNGKIEIATDINNVIGVVSSTASFVADTASLDWQGRFLKDKWGRIIFDEIDGELIPRENPDYDSSLPYVPRSKRKEWSPIGLIGKVYVRQDGTLNPGDYAGCNNGIATKVNSSNYRVISIIDNEIAIILIK